ncbi:hypothetical protein [Paracoccus lutimaris]|uniref:hypothetical protein n=1 Tax=Paracoccus lutimaris TaxID=1490030 RepID=UPI000DF25284|nr:hypothetical protein [Paracoccus lutimaris]
MATASPVWNNQDTPHAPQKRVRLASTVDCRLEMTKLYREARNGRLKIEDCSRLVNVLALISRSFVDTDLSERIAALEAEQ